MTDRMLVSIYAVAGLVVAIGAWVSIGRVGSVSPTSFYEGNLDSITAVVIGGTSFSVDEVQLLDHYLEH